MTPKIVEATEVQFEEVPLFEEPKIIMEELKTPVLNPAASFTGPLEIIDGSYLGAIQAAIPETIQTSEELQKARVEFNNRGDDSLNKLEFYTANVPLYGVENGKPFLLFGEREAFLQLYVSNIEKVCEQIISPNQVYILPEVDKARALGVGILSGALKRFDLAELIETIYDDKYGYFTVSTNKAAQLTGARRELAELIHGQGEDYFNTFKMLAESGISKTKVFVLNQDYVKSIARNNLLGRASWLGDFDRDSYFYAGIRCFGSGYRVRGVRKK